MAILSLKITLSVGIDTFDNKPKQKSFNSRDELVEWLSDQSKWSTKKGQQYICSPMAKGPHNQPDKYPGNEHWRLAKNIQSTSVLTFDFDGFKSVNDFKTVIRYINDTYCGCFYTTASSTQSTPRCRVIIFANKSMNRGQRIAACEGIEADIKAKFGKDAAVFDQSVYRGEQPVYMPTVGAKFARLNGNIADVSKYLTNHRIKDNLSRGRHRRKVCNINLILANRTPPDETPEAITRVQSMLSAIPADGDRDTWRNIVWSILATGWSVAEELASVWSRTAPKLFDDTDFLKVIRSFDENRSDSIGYGTLLHHAKQHGYVAGGSHD